MELIGWPNTKEINTLRSQQIGHDLVNYILKCIFWAEKVIVCFQFHRSLIVMAITRNSEGPVHRPVLLLQLDAVASRLINGSADFVWKLRCHWLRGINVRQHQILVVMQASVIHISITIPPWILGEYRLFTSNIPGSLAFNADHDL